MSRTQEKKTFTVSFIFNRKGKSKHFLILFNMESVESDLFKYIICKLIGTKLKSLKIQTKVTKQKAIIWYKKNDRTERLISAKSGSK